MLLYVARHGETNWNREGRYQGQLESELTDIGREQARALGEALGGRPIGAIFSSPLQRCRNSAQPLADARGLQVGIDRRLIEIAHGSWEGRLRTDIEYDDADRYVAWRQRPGTVHFPGGESLARVLQRWRAFVRELKGYDEVAVVTHDVLVRLAILDSTHRPLEKLWEPRVINGGYARFEMSGGRPQLLDECVDAHLDGIVVNTAAQAL